MSSLKRQATEIIQPPEPKRAKIGLQNRTSSFADTLKGMEKEHPDADWPRPEPKINSEEALTFQQISIEEDVDGDMLVYGVTKEGNSVAARVSGFRPYFYVRKEDVHTDEEISKLKEYIKTDTKREVEVLLSERRELDGYSTSGPTSALKISAGNSSALGDVLDTSCDIKSTYGAKFGSPKLYDASLPSTLQFMAERNISGMGWVEIAAGYERVSDISQKTRCQFEVSAELSSIRGLPSSDDLVEYAPLRLLSFDIETRIPQQGFPQAKYFPVIQIGNMMMYQGDETPSVRAIFTVKSCAPIEGASVFFFETEKEMLEAWRRFVINVDPDILIGHNIWGFDLPYLFTRASIVGAEEFAFLGRRKDDKAIPRLVKLSVGNRLIDTKDLVFSGRVQLDTLAFFTRERPKLPKKTLSFLGVELIGPEYDKEEFEITKINELQDGDEDSRRRIAIYCLKDVYLPLQILNEVSGVENYIEVCRVTGVPFSYLQRHGEDIRAKSIIVRTALQMGCIIPEHKFNGKKVRRIGNTLDLAMPDMPTTTEISVEMKEKIDHIKVNNICFSTRASKLQIIDGGLRLGIDVKTVNVNRTAGNFVVPSVEKGMISTMLESLLSRQQAIVRSTNEARYLALMTTQATIASYTERALRNIIIAARPTSLISPA